MTFTQVIIVPKFHKDGQKGLCAVNISNLASLLLGVVAPDIPYPF